MRHPSGFLIARGKWNTFSPAALPAKAMRNIDTDRNTLNPSEVADLQLAVFGYKRFQAAEAMGVPCGDIVRSRAGTFSVLKARDIGHAIAKGIEGGHILLPSVESSHLPVHTRVERSIAWLKGMELLVNQVLLKRR